MSGHYQRLAVWANTERRLDTCEYCKKQDPTYNCEGHFDARAGYDTSLHPEVPLCQEGGGADRSIPTTFVEEYGICFLNSTGGVPDSYCGTNIVLHEFFHSVHEVRYARMKILLQFLINNHFLFYGNQFLTL